MQISVPVIERETEQYIMIHGKEQGFPGLPCRHEVAMDSVIGECREITTAWRPTAEELAALNAGASVYVHIRGWPNPVPMLVDVGPVPEYVPDVEGWFDWKVKG